MLGLVLEKAAARPRVAVPLTAFAGERDRQLALEAGFDRHVAEPFDAQTLMHDLLSEGNARLS